MPVTSGVTFVNRALSQELAWTYFAARLRCFILGLLVATAVSATGQVRAEQQQSGAPVNQLPVADEEVAPVSGGEAGSKQRNPNAPDPAWRPPAAPKVITPTPVDAEQAAKLAERWGVKLLSLKLGAAGYMMDFRFRVLDVDKALPLFDHRNKPYLVVERSNARLPVPMAAKVGSFRTTNRGKNIKPDKNYYMMFANPDRHVKAGDKVSMVIGDFKVERLTVN